MAQLQTRPVQRWQRLKLTLGPVGSYWRRQGLAFLVSACAGTPAQAPAATAPPDMTIGASPARGLAYAQSVCAACHAVETGQTSSPNPEATPFEVIANLPGMTSTALNAWLHSPHPNMPNLIVAPEDRDDVAAYLNSLKYGAGRG